MLPDWVPCFIHDGTEFRGRIKCSIDACLGLWNIPTVQLGNGMNAIVASRNGKRCNLYNAHTRVQRAQALLVSGRAESTSATARVVKILQRRKRGTHKQLGKGETEIPTHLRKPMRIVIF